MSTSLKRVAGFIGASAITMGLGIMAASTAFADPAGCKGGYPNFTVDSIGKMVSYGAASCSGTATRTWRVEIKQAISAQPDPLLASNSHHATARSYGAYVESCDHAKKANYYGRTFFTTNTTYRDSGHWNNVRVC